MSLLVDKRASAIAHLYMAIAKADGHVSAIEKATMLHGASRSMGYFNLFGCDTDHRTALTASFEKLLNTPEFTGWTASDHLDHAIELLRSLLQSGDLDSAFAGLRHEKSLEELAWLDGYILKESQFLAQVKSRLQELLNEPAEGLDTPGTSGTRW